MVSPLGAEFADDGIEGFWICAKHLLDHCRGVANNSSTGTGGKFVPVPPPDGGSGPLHFQPVTQLTSGQSRQETGPNTCDNTLTIVLPFFHCITPSLAGSQWKVDLYCCALGCTREARVAVVPTMCIDFTVAGTISSAILPSPCRSDSLPTLWRDRQHDAAGQTGLHAEAERAWSFDA